MPRQSRIDTAGALHHIMVRGIEKTKIFRSDADRDNFLERLGNVLNETKTTCYAWALIPNHFHLLLQTGPIPISTVMRRLLTGYSLWFNRRYRRHGHVFQNRFKSILCQEESYLLELVRYIHLNPLRVGVVKTLDELNEYAYSGQSVLMGKVKRDWQNEHVVLGRFGEHKGAARRAYKAFVENGISEEKRHDLTGGGLLRSAGGWEGVKALREQKVYQKHDERILGNGEFVAEVLASAEEKMEKVYGLKARGMNIDKIATRVTELLGLAPEEIWAKGKYKRLVEARSLLCYWAVRELGMPMSALANRLGISAPAVSGAVARGWKFVEEKGLKLLET